MSNEKIKEQLVTAEDVAKGIVPESAPQEATKENKPVVGETLYTRAEIQASPSAFGVMPEVLAGALSLVDGDKLSRSQVTKAIEEFKNRKV
ncbi:hypothetical protein NCCP2222_01860 [Sporosarcina sp. NCCP-2222]|uniref:oligoribonuclease n=1 Tax=Sporosarcina sp. NCCP-2222 TaxID=2935073 RepID=UPI00208C347F|nr:oligoribonuclease [Sporosarcina sp. NCCP-2222]GKV54239.1 hypothetical protein NCCP2222_01860 [Sporosarcina sp. NCCP-2222]